MMENKMAIEKNAYKNWLTIGLVAAALSISACGKKDEAPMDVEPTADAQTAVEDEATGVATAGSTDDVAIASANGSSNNTNQGMAVGENDDVAVATADDAEVLDGTESEEHVSTY
ncbi:hypothetical protein [Psychrobacter sp. ANT_WB68]|uniref:hypothetical protein n=1 Tax=Psychrobacter sp. ANT_WB68 TaxID=2597355 RepID=UPI0011F138BA|nr:hypothetical protein [Psychrobacter sp. ANT_WB68]KAA0913720.1 hypothetical protein FQ084_10590 [Psychrobacter sp. ANT_WB68]